MPLWTDLMEPYEATGIARAEQYLLEQRNGTLARWLPNVYVDSDHVKFYSSANGLVDEARYREFNAPPEIGKSGPVKSGLIELPAISRNEPIDEATQKALRNMSADQMKKSVTNAIRRTVQSISDRQERTRGVLIDKGRVLVNQDNNFLIDDDFGRDPALNVVAGTGKWWNDATVDRLAAMSTWQDVYASFNASNAPGTVLMDKTTFAALAGGNQFATLLPGGATRPAERQTVISTVESQGLPTIVIYSRSTAAGKVLDPKKIYFLPDATTPDDPDGTDLGATFWGTTVTAQSSEFNLQPGEMSGIVVGLFKEDRIPYTIEVQGDSIGEPVARNANASMAVQVLP